MITAHFTIHARITMITARSCEAAKIHSTWRTTSERFSRPPSHANTDTTARTITVHFVEEGFAAPVPSVRAAALVERRVHRCGRRLAHVLRHDEHDPVVLRQVEPAERGAVARTQARAVCEEEGHVGPHFGSEIV